MLIYYMNSQKEVIIIMSGLKKSIRMEKKSFQM